MLCLHTMSDPIIHRDLKSLNVLVKRKDGKWVMKLGDFGLSRCMGEIMTGQLGTIVHVYFILSIGWLQSFSRAKSIARKLMFTHLEYCYGKS